MGMFGYDMGRVSRLWICVRGYGVEGVGPRAGVYDGKSLTFLEYTVESRVRAPQERHLI